MLDQAHAKDGISAQIQVHVQHIAMMQMHLRRFVRPGAQDIQTIVVVVHNMILDGPKLSQNSIQEAAIGTAEFNDHPSRSVFSKFGKCFDQDPGRVFPGENSNE